MRKLSIDYGQKRIGLAISDIMGIVAFPLETFVSQSIRKDVEYIAQIVESKAIGTVVLGIPYNMDGSIGRRAKDTQFFGSILKKVLSVPIVFSDERLTSIEAESQLIQMGVKLSRRKRLVDKVAAQIILQEYLDNALQSN